MEVSEEERLAYLEDRTGCLAGINLVNRFGWELGQKIALESQTWPVDLEFTLRAVYEGGSDLGNSFYFHWDYWNEAMKEVMGGQWDATGTFTVRVRDSSQISRVAEDGSCHALEILDELGIDRPHRGKVNPGLGKPLSTD